MKWNPTDSGNIQKMPNIQGAIAARDTLSEAAFYLRKTKTGGYIDLKPVLARLVILHQAIVSETQKLQASGISYKAIV